MIIECKCNKYKFKIPDKEIVLPGRNVQCEICSEEWYLEFSKDQKETSIKSDQDILYNISSSKTKKNINLKKKENNSSALRYTLIFLILFFLFYQLIIHYKIEILSYNKNFNNFYESLEIVTEIVNAYFVFLKEFISEKFNYL